MSTAYAYQFRVDNYASERGRLEVQLALRQVTSTEYARELDKLAREHGADAKAAYERDKADRQREVQEAANARAAKEAAEKQSAEEAIVTERNAAYGPLAPAFDPEVRGAVSPMAYLLARGDRDEAQLLDQLHSRIVTFWLSRDRNTTGKEDYFEAWMLIMAHRLS